MEENKTEIKRLYRSRKDKVVAGVCGGIAEYFNIDPVWARLVMVLLLFADGIGIILYIVAWILVPFNPEQKETKKTAAEKTAEKISKKVQRKERNTALIFGLILIIIGLGIMLKNMFSWFTFHYVWPVILIGIGLYILFWRSKDEE